MSAQSSLRDCFLVAMPGLQDPNFARSVTYIFEHSKDGAMGIVINLPLTITLQDIFESMKIKSDSDTFGQAPVLAGGPVQPERGFILHPSAPPQSGPSPWQSTLVLNSFLSITTSKDILEAIASGKGPEKKLIALGYAGWEANQLEEEIKQNSWLHTKATPNILFDTPYHARWQKTLDQMGITLGSLSKDIGHA
jgi:putative transcriptional regulator